MKLPTFADAIKTSLDVAGINRYFLEDDSGKVLEILQRLRPEGNLQGERYKMASVTGGAGNSADFNIRSHVWGDWGNNNSQKGQGLVNFLQVTLKCTQAQAVKWLTDEKFFDSKEARKVLREAEGNPLILPIPPEKASWEAVLECDALRKDRALITAHWAYHDTDGQLLGYQYRVDGPHGKVIYPVTYRAHTGWTKKALSKRLVPLYGLEKLSDGPTVRIVIVEGEKATAAAQQLLGKRYKVLGFSGVKASQSLWIPDSKIWQDVEVILWPDNDTAGRDAMRRVQLQLQNLTHAPREIRIVRVESIAGIPPKWDLADWDKDCGVDVLVELERAEEVDSFERICREWVYVTDADQFHNLVDRSIIISVGSFDRRYAMYGDKSGSPSKKFLNERDTKKVEALEFLPGEPEFVTSYKGKLFLNEWVDSAALVEARAIAADQSITTAEIAANAPYFIQHIERVCSGQHVEAEVDRETQEVIPGTEDRKVSDALLYYFSQVISRPQDKIGWVPLLVSATHGTGKSYFLEMVKAVLGGNRTSVVETEDYLSGYDDWRDGVVFYELAEVQADEKAGVYDTVKKNHNRKPFDFGASTDRMVNMLKLNIKSRGMKNQRDFINGMITSNHLHPLALGDSSDTASDRRLFVIRCEQKLEKYEADTLYDELITSAKWIGAYLLRFKPAFDWNLGHAPITEHKRAMFEKNEERAAARNDRKELGRFDEFYYFIQLAQKEKIGGFARQVITSEIVREICQLRHIRYPYDITRFDRIMARAGLPFGKEFSVDGQLRRCYAAPSWAEKDEKEWRAELARSINGGI